MILIFNCERIFLSLYVKQEEDIREGKMQKDKRMISCLLF